MKFNIQEYIKEKKQLIDNQIEQTFSSIDESASNLERSMHYSIKAGGKRLRPILCLSACESVGGDTKGILPIACAIEMIHTYSLIHDDLPSMDDDDLRRGVATNHKVFGEATAILAGDALLTDAFYVIAELGLSNGLKPDIVLEVIKDLSKATGSKGMVKGQSIDLSVEGSKDVDLNMVEKIHSLKTGALIETSVIVGGKTGGATKEQLRDLKKYSNLLGLAYQIVDDILDIIGESEIGKERGSDFRRKKVTYPELVGIDESKVKIKDLTSKAIHSLVNFDHKADPLRQIALYIGERKN
ncbi:MAG: farnesyl diphosphate synthase [Thermodesulfobacteriota bacterium]